MGTRRVAAAILVAMIAATAVGWGVLSRRSFPSLMLPIFPFYDIDGKGSSAVVLGAGPDQTRWQAFLCRIGHQPRVVRTGRGSPISVSMSPDGSQLLLCWSEAHPGGTRLGLRVEQMRLTGESLESIGGWDDEIFLHHSPFGTASPWGPGGRWLAYRLSHKEGEPGTRVIHHDGKTVALKRAPRRTDSTPRLYWLSGSGDSAYVLESDGWISRLSATSTCFVVKVPLSGKARVAALGDVVFVLSGERLTRVDLKAGATETKTLARSTATTETVHQVLALTPESLVLVLSASGNASRTSDVCLLRFGDMSLDRMMSVPVGGEDSVMVYTAGDQRRVWIAWMDDHRQDTVLTSRLIPEPRGSD